MCNPIHMQEDQPSNRVPENREKLLKAHNLVIPLLYDIQQHNRIQVFIIKRKDG